MSSLLDSLATKDCRLSAGNSVRPRLACGVRREYAVGAALDESDVSPTKRGNDLFMIDPSESREARFASGHRHEPAFQPGSTCAARDRLRARCARNKRLSNRPPA